MGHYPVHPFSTRLSQVRNRPGTWNSTLVEILMEGEKIGEYVRQYPSHAAETFEPFKLGDRWFALYSADYTCTRIMSLPDCTDIGGEESHAAGFCPAELYVPHYRLYDFDMILDHRQGQRVEPYIRRESVVLWPWEEEEIKEAEAEIAQQTSDQPVGKGTNPALSGWIACPFGFVAGCHWGDDSSWKVEFFDLSAAADGKIVRKAAFGYAEMPPSMSLRQVVDMTHWEHGRDRIGLITSKWFDVRNGEGREV